MQRENFNINTHISFYIALAIIILIPAALVSAIIPLNEIVISIIRIAGGITFFLSIFGIPLSVVSLFSKENIVKRIFSLVVNASPLSIGVYALIMEMSDEFFKLHLIAAAFIKL